MTLKLSRGFHPPKTWHVSALVILTSLKQLMLATHPRNHVHPSTSAWLGCPGPFSASGQHHDSCTWSSPSPPGLSWLLSASQALTWSQPHPTGPAAPDSTRPQTRLLLTLFLQLLSTDLKLLFAHIHSCSWGTFPLSLWFFSSVSGWWN